MKISRFITRDSRLVGSIANFAIAVGETTFSLANVVLNSSPIWREGLLYSLWLKRKQIKRVWRPRKPPYSSRHPTSSYMFWRAWEASLSCYAWPSLIRSLATPASDKEGCPETRQLVCSAQCPTSRRRHISLPREAIGKRHKSGISSLASTTSDSDAMPTYKVNNANISVTNAAGLI